MQTAARYLKIVPSELRLETTLKCGQSFRWVRIPSEEPSSFAFRGAFRDRVVTLVQTRSQIEYSSIFPEDYTGVDDTKEFLEDYLNLKVDLNELYSYWSSRDQHFANTSKQFLGLRMLRQDPFENLLSFICSSNNNISRITLMVQNLCRHYGKHIADVDGLEFYTFPKPEALMHSALTDELRALGFGYRAKFIAATVQQLSNHPDNYLDNLREKTYEEAHTELMQLMGVGAKVADCVCLMSLDKHQAVPIDTHVLQIAQRDYKFKAKGSSMTKLLYDAIKNYFIDLWGPYAGWAHSVLFVADLKAFQTGAVETWTEIEEDMPKAEIKLVPDTISDQMTVTENKVAIKLETSVSDVSNTYFETEPPVLGKRAATARNNVTRVKRAKRTAIKTEND